MAMSNLQIEKLAGRENYSTWKFAVKSYLQHEDLWECVDPGTEVDFKKDVKAKSKIILLVEPINYVHIENAQSSREVWTNLQNAFEDSGLSRKVGLLRDLINTTLDNCATVEEYVNKIMSTAYKLRNIGFQVDDEWLGTLMLAGLPDNYKPMIMGLESSGIKISSDFVKTKLLQEVKVSESSALFTKHKNTSKTNAKQKGKGPRCYNCNKYGHFKNQCQEKKSNQNSFSAVFSAYSNVDKDEWYIDSGATMHMTRRSDWMYDMQASPIHQIKVANDDVVSVQNMGKVNIKTIFCKDECPIQVRNVLYIPELSVNLLSVSQLTKNGCKVEFTDTGCNIFNANKILIANARLLNNMYKLNTASVNAYAVACESKTDIMTWHKRMGHLNLADVKRLESCAEGITITNKDVDTVCIPCCEAKQTRLPFPHSGSRAKALLEIVHTDLCGPMETPSAGGAKYFITFIDDYSRKVYVYFLKNKMDIKSVFQKFKEEVENELERKIKIVRSDNGKEYCNNEFSVFLAASGIKHQTSTPYTPEHNGLAERMNRSLVERAKSMLFEAKLQKQLWAEAVTTAAYVINRSPSRVLAEVVDVRATLNILIRYAPFYFILIIKFLYDCREGIFTFLILFVTFTHCNSIIRRENVKQMHRSLSSCLLEMFTTLGIVAIVHYLFGHGKLLYNVVMFPAYSNLNIWELLWLIILTDLIVKIITVNIKMVVTILPSSILPYQKRGRVFLFMESVSQLYRSLLTIQPWIFYLMQSYDDSEKLMGMFLTSIYVICKIIEVTIRLRVFKNAAWSMVQNVDLGTKPSREQLSAAGEACPICHDEYTTPVRLDCSHIFCELCISAWLDREHTCPLCRAKVSDEPTWRDGSTTFDFQLY